MRRFVTAPSSRAGPSTVAGTNGNDNVRRVVGQQFTFQGYYNVETRMLNSDYQRLQRWRARRGTMPATEAFEPHRTVEFHFIPNLDRFTEDPDALQQDFDSFMGYIGRMDQNRVTVTLQLTRQTAEHATQPLGGLAQVIMRFNGRPDIDLSGFMQMMLERNYYGFMFRDVKIVVEIRMLDFVRLSYRGGSVPLDLSVFFKDIPLIRYPLCTFQTWPASAKSHFRKVQVHCGPHHLASVKGLLFYKWKPEWSRYCGLMAILYAYKMSQANKWLRQIVDEFGTKDASDKFKERHAYFVDEINKLQDGELLYQKALHVIAENDWLGFAEYPSLYHLSQMCHSLYPDRTLVVYDISRHILHRSQPPVQARVVPDPPATPYQQGELTSDIVALYNEQRICVFYDHTYKHFLPIFNVDTFLQRRLIDVAYRIQDLRTVLPIEEHSTVVHTKDKAMSFCPFCDSGLYKGNESSHACNILRCDICKTTFTNIRDKMEHCNPKQKKQRCKTCHQVCVGAQCLKRHQRGCERITYYRCPVCLSHIKSAQRAFHKCRSYYCDNCDDKVVNRIDYTNPYHPNGYIVYHQCSMRNKLIRQEQRQQRLIDLGKVLESTEGVDERYFAFDFESMLTRDEFRGFVIHIHTVNCVSTCPIVISESGDVLSVNDIKQSISTQWDLHTFWDFVKEQSVGAKNYWIAHNFKGYDGRLLYDFLTHDLGLMPFSLVKSGGKLMRLVYLHPDEPSRELIFQDSLNHIARSLAKMPEMFGLDTAIIKKGYFPYLFNIPEHQNYVGFIPDPEYFDIDKQFDKTAFTAWYVERSRTPYDFRQEMRDYCENDVLILSLSLSAYMGICLKYSHQNNPLPCMTIAQYTFFLYQQRYLPDKTVYFLDESFDTFARRSLHGGNTNVRRLYYECTPEEAGTFTSGDKGLRYIDIQSLYPTVQFYDPMPVGYPRTAIYYTDQPNESLLRSFFGFIECDIEPVRFTFHPLLCRFSGQRLFMDLHPHRRIVLTSAEFQAACYGTHQDSTTLPYYVCTNVYRIDHYDKSYSLFKPFIRNWLKLKIIAGKPPPEHLFADYQAKLRDTLGISVELNEFQRNESLRTLAKLVLNSLWGKFGQRTGMPRTEILRTASDIYEYHENVRMGNIIEKDHVPIGNVGFMAVCVHPQEWNKKNTAIASFVTACARLRLWSTMNKLQERVVYHDTDSIIYERSSADDMMIEEGAFLGDWESETGDRMIHQFVSLAPKTYAYRYKTEAGVIKECVKSKGFSMNGLTQAELTFDSYQALLRGTVRDIGIPTTFFRHCPEAGVTFTHQGVKRLKFDYRKGFIDWSTMKTYPFGSQKFIENSVFNDTDDQIVNSDEDFPELVEPSTDDDDSLFLQELLCMYDDDDDSDADAQ